MKHRTPKNDLERIGLVMSRYRALSKSRLITKMTIGRMEQDLDIGYFDIIELVGRSMRRGKEVIVGTVAEKMHLDPSRASRAVAHLVDKGLLKRAVSQEDARRSVILLSDRGMDVLREKVAIKQDLIAKIFETWTEEEVATFAELYTRFIDDFERLAEEPLCDSCSKASEDRS